MENLSINFAFALYPPINKITWFLNGMIFIHDPLNLTWLTYFFLVSALCIKFSQQYPTAVSQLTSKLLVGSIFVEYSKSVGRSSSVWGEVSLVKSVQAALQWNKSMFFWKQHCLHYCLLFFYCVQIFPPSCSDISHAEMVNVDCRRPQSFPPGISCHQIPPKKKNQCWA